METRCSLSRHIRFCCIQSAQVLDAELTKHKAANAGIERDVARFKEREAIHKKVLCIKTRPPLCRWQLIRGEWSAVSSSDRLAAAIHMRLRCRWKAWRGSCHG